MISSAKEFIKLRLSEVRDEYTRAIDEEAPLSVWMEIIANYPKMKCWVVLNKTVPIEVLRVLAEDVERNVRAAVADKRKLDYQLFFQLSFDPDEVVRQRIAYNKKTPIEILERLNQDESELVRNVAIRRICY